MIYYLLALLWAYFITFSACRLGLKVSWLLVLPLVLFAALRGSSGKDTPAYMHRFHFGDFQFEDILQIDSEPVLNLLIMLSRAVFGDSIEIFFGLYAFLLTFAYIFIARNLNDFRIYTFTVGPVFLIDGITNGMRISFAYHVLLVGFALRRQLAPYVLALGSHVTAIVPIFIRLYFQTSLLYLAGAAIFGLAALVFFEINPLYYFNESGRLVSKFDHYAVTESTNWYSGIVDLCMLFALITLHAFYSKMPSSRRIVYILGAILLCALLQIGIQQSSAFVRITKLIIIGLICSEFFTQSRSKIPNRILILLGFGYSLNFMRQVLVDPGFLPYGE